MAMDEARRLLIRLEELAQRAADRWTCAFTLFLDPAQLSLAQAAARQAGAQTVAWGGYAEAERQLCAFLPEVWKDEIPWPLAAVVIRWNRRFAQPGHRDLLGSLMALGFKREVLGDILVLMIMRFVLFTIQPLIILRQTYSGLAAATVTGQPRSVIGAYAS